MDDDNSYRPPLPGSIGTRYQREAGDSRGEWGTTPSASAEAGRGDLKTQDDDDYSWRGRDDTQKASLIPMTLSRR